MLHNLILECFHIFGKVALGYTDYSVERIAVKLR